MCKGINVRARGILVFFVFLKKKRDNRIRITDATPKRITISSV